MISSWGGCHRGGLWSGVTASGGAGRSSGSAGASGLSQIRSACEGLFVVLVSCTVVRWASFVLGLAGWVGALWSYLDHGYDAGVNPGFITALSVGICFTIIWARAMADRDNRDQERVYALGVRHGLALAAEMSAAEPSKAEPRLRAVR